MAKFRYFYQVKKINFFIVRFTFYKILGDKHLYNVDKVLPKLNPGILKTSDCNDTIVVEQCGRVLLRSDL